ncbi:hypothetical protein OH76DRAFT_1490440 [Lentinus brumalis]|uniref:Uncharacterized protein n=1 Tax=Lentinus brumalis TaxID=2498619 RepID=A0A371CJ22_9APHY|nr:hypothetical protein OH76DRAFT_1490440 [Polyporus brumalis]
MGADKSRRSYVSGSVDVRTSRGFGRSPLQSTLKLSQQYKRRTTAARNRIQLISGLSFEERDQLMHIDSNDGQWQDSDDEG